MSSQTRPTGLAVLRLIPTDELTAEDGLSAITADPRAISSLPDRLLTPDFMREAVLINPDVLTMNIPDSARNIALKNPVIVLGEVNAEHLLIATYDPNEHLVHMRGGKYGDHSVGFTSHLNNPAKTQMTAQTHWDGYCQNNAAESTPLLPVPLLEYAQKYAQGFIQIVPDDIDWREMQRALGVLGGVSHTYTTMAALSKLQSFFGGLQKQAVEILGEEAVYGKDATTHV